MALELRNNNTELWLTAGSKIPVYDVLPNDIATSNETELITIIEDYKIFPSEFTGAYLSLSAMGEKIVTDNQTINNLVGQCIYSKNKGVCTGNVELSIFVAKWQTTSIRFFAFSDANTPSYLSPEQKESGKNNGFFYDNITISGSIDTSKRMGSISAEIGIIEILADAPVGSYPNTLIEKLEYMKASKLNIKDAIIEKGGVVNDSTPLKDYAQAIRDLPSGGDRRAVMLEVDISNEVEQGISTNIVIGGE